MKKNVFAAIMIVTIFSAVSASAAEVDFSNIRIYPVDTMEKLGVVSLAEDENTITLSCNSVSELNEKYYISVYQKGTVEGAHYIVKYFGPVQISDFSISGLEGGKDYKIFLSSVGNQQQVSGKITTSKTEVSSK